MEQLGADRGSIPPFGKFEDENLWRGRVPNRKFLAKVFMLHGSKDYDLRNVIMQNLTGSILKCDHTFKVAKVLTKKGTKIFEALLTVMNEKNMVLGY